MDTLKDRLIKAREGKLEASKIQLSPLFDEISAASAALSERLRELNVAEAEADIDPGLLRSATEARKLLVDKVSRAISGIGRAPEMTGEGLTAYDQRLSKGINLTTDAMKTHGRYVRAAFGQKSAEFESGLRNIHDLAMRMHSAIEDTVKQSQCIEAILSEISALSQIKMDQGKNSEDIKSLENRVKTIEESMGEERGRLDALKSGEEFRRATESIREFDRTEQEIAGLKATATSLISEMSRPFRKLEKLIKSGGHSVEGEVIRILDICINRPMDVISSGENLSALEKLLRVTADLASADKIDLDKRERKNTIDASQRLISELSGIREALANKGKLREAQKKASDSPALSQAMKIETLIKQHEYDLGEARAALEELRKKSKLLDEERATKTEGLKKQAGVALGLVVNLTESLAPNINSDQITSATAP